MSTPYYPTAAEVRLGMRAIKVASAELDTLMKAQIAQSLFDKPIAERHQVLLGVWGALGSLSDAIMAYYALLDLHPDSAPDVIHEEVTHGEVTA